jgi:hypothetical protein
VTLIRFEPLDEDGSDYDALLDSGRPMARALARALKTPVWVLGHLEGEALDIIALDATGKVRWTRQGDRSTPRRKGRLDDDLEFPWEERVDADGEPTSRPVWRQQVRLTEPPPVKRPSPGRRGDLMRLAAWKATLGPAHAELFADGPRRLRHWPLPSAFALRLELVAMELDVLPETLIERRWAEVDPGSLDISKLEDSTESCSSTSQSRSSARWRRSP